MAGEGDGLREERTNGGVPGSTWDAVRSTSEPAGQTTTAEETDAVAGSNGTRDAAGASGMVKYRWTCPVCGETGTGLTPPEQGLAYSINNLRSHIRTTGDDAHGPTNAYPAALDAELEKYVEFRRD